MVMKTAWRKSIPSGQGNRIESSETGPCVHTETQDAIKVPHKSAGERMDRLVTGVGKTDPPNGGK